MDMAPQWPIGPDNPESESDPASLSPRSALLSPPFGDDTDADADGLGNLPRRSSRGPSIKFRHARERVHSAASARDLLRLLVSEEYESQQTRKMLYTAFERLENETRRAEAAESRIEETIQRAGAVNEARVTAQEQAVTAQEELKLYKMQLDNAQKEILRAQDVLKAIEAQRDGVEAAAVSARSKARRLNEERLIELAREEGRRLGFEEGVRRGRRIAYREAYSAGGDDRRSEMQEAATEVVDGLLEERDEPGRIEVLEEPRPIPPLPTPRASPAVTHIETSINPSLDNLWPSSRGRQDSSDSASRSTSTPRQAPEIFGTGPRVIPSRAPSTPTAASHTSRPRSGSQPWACPADGPISIQNSSPGTCPADFHIPPDNCIPTIDANHGVTLPPPHEMQRIPSPTHSQQTLGQNSERVRSRDYVYDNSPPHRASPDESFVSTKRSDALSISQLDIVGLVPVTAPSPTPESPAREAEALLAEPQPEAPFSTTTPPLTPQRKSTFRARVGGVILRSSTASSIPGLPNRGSSASSPPQDSDTTSVASSKFDRESFTGSLNEIDTTPPQPPVTVSGAPSPIPESPAREVAALLVEPQPAAAKASSSLANEVGAEAPSSQRPRSVASTSPAAESILATPIPPQPPAAQHQSSQTSSAVIVDERNASKAEITPILTAGPEEMPVLLPRPSIKSATPPPASPPVTPATLSTNHSSYFGDVPCSTTPVGLDNNSDTNIWADHLASGPVGFESGSEVPQGRELTSKASKSPLRPRDSSVAFSQVAPLLPQSRIISRKSNAVVAPSQTELAGATKTWSSSSDLSLGNKMSPPSNEDALEVAVQSRAAPDPFATDYVHTLGNTDCSSPRDDTLTPSEPQIPLPLMSEFTATGLIRQPSGNFDKSFSDNEHYYPRASDELRPLISRPSTPPIVTNFHGQTAVHVLNDIDHRSPRDDTLMSSESQIPRPAMGAGHSSLRQTSNNFDERIGNHERYDPHASDQIAHTYRNTNISLSQPIPQWAQPARFDVNGSARNYAYSSMTRQIAARGCAEYALPRSTRYRVNEESRANTDLSLWNLIPLNEVSNVLDVVEVPGHRVGVEEPAIFVDHHHSHSPVRYEVPSNDYASPDDRVDYEQRYCTSIEMRSTCIPQAIVESASDDGIDVPHWSDSDRLLSHPHLPPTLPLFSQDECLELLQPLNDPDHPITTEAMPLETMPKTPSHLFSLAAHGARTNFRALNPFPRDNSYPQLSRMTHIRCTTFEFFLSIICLGIPFLLVGRTRHCGHSDIEGTHLPEGTTLLFAIGICACSLSAIVLSASVTLISFPGLDSIARVGGLFAIACSVMSMVSSFVSIFRYRGEMARMTDPSTDRFVILPRRSFILSVPLVFLAYSVAGFVTGVVACSFRSSALDRAGVVTPVAAKFDECMRLIVAGVLGARRGALIISTAAA